VTDWSQIVKQHGPIVWRTANRLLDNEADAADCFQNTFVAALEFERKQRVRNWPGLLQQLATARALDRLRARYRESERQSSLPDAPIKDDCAVEPSATAEARELAERLRRALTTLQRRQAEVFCLACLDGLSYEQIADQMGVTVNNVGVLLTRARSGLRERLHNEKVISTSESSKREIP
jgi:RNA polymerase sigma-70 factor (ECF subfamily)